MATGELTVKLHVDDEIAAALYRLLSAPEPSSMPVRFKVALGELRALVAAGLIVEHRGP